MGELVDLTRALADALTAAGLTAHNIYDPAGPPGVVIDAPRVDWGDNVARAGCGHLKRGEITLDLIVVGAGFAPEQVEALYDDAETAMSVLRDSTAPPWRIQTLAGGATPDAPTYTITAQA